MQFPPKFELRGSRKLQENPLNWNLGSNWLGKRKKERKYSHQQLAGEEFQRTPQRATQYERRGLTQQRYQDQQEENKIEPKIRAHRGNKNPKGIRGD